MTTRPVRRHSQGHSGLSSRVPLVLALAGYNFLLLAMMPVALTWLLWRILVQGKALGNLGHRLGLVPRLPASDRPSVWLHAASAGEMAALRPVAEALRHLRPEAFLVVSTVTPAGLAMAERTAIPAEARFFLPFDLLPCALLALRRVRPQVLVVTEKELWPNLLGLARLGGARVVVVNARVSDRTMRRARFAPGLVRWLHSLPDHFCAQSPRDRDRLLSLGVPAQRLSVAGNTKVDALAEPDRTTETALRAALCSTSDELWLVAGSTHPGEEDQVLEAFVWIRRQAPEARLLLAPRHLTRLPQVEQLASGKGLSPARRSEAAKAPGPAGAPVVILDTMGELRAAYALGVAGFVGGTLVPVGGHNLLEPVAWGRPAIFGPYTANCADVADLLLAEGVGVRVEGPQELAEVFLGLARDLRRREEIARRCQQMMASQRGAAQRCAETVVACLERQER